MKPIHQQLTKPGRVTLGAQAAVIAPDGRVLLIRHGYRPGWHFPGGGVEQNEDVSEAVARELREETGVELNNAPEIFGIYEHFEQFPGDHIVLYLVKSWHQPAIPPPNKEIAEQAFFSPAELPAGTSLGTKRRIAEIFFDQPRACSW